MTNLNLTSDILVNNAGINIRKPIEEMEVDEWDAMMRINSLHPSTVETDLVKKMLSDPERMKERIDEVKLY